MILTSSARWRPGERKKNRVAGHAQKIRELFEFGFTGGDIDVIERIADPAMTYVQPSVPPGLDGLRVIVELNNDAFTDWRFVIDELIESGDRIAVRWTARGRHENTYVGEGPTNREVTLSGISIYGFRGDRIVEAWSSPDTLGLLQQIGVVPEMTLVD